MEAEEAKLSDGDRARLDIELAELGFVYNQMHIRMQAIYHYISNGILLFTVLLGLSIYNWNTIKEGLFLFLWMPIPFYFLTLLQMREDFLNASHDEYFFQMRRRILHLTGTEYNGPMLRFLHHIYEWKVGSFYLTMVSALRYAFFAFSCALPVGGFFWFTKIMAVSPASTEYSILGGTFHSVSWSAIEAGFFWLNILGFILVFVVLGRKAKAHFSQIYEKWALLPLSERDAEPPTQPKGTPQQTDEQNDDKE